MSLISNILLFHPPPVSFTLGGRIKGVNDDFLLWLRVKDNCSWNKWISNSWAILEGFLSLIFLPLGISIWAICCKMSRLPEDIIITLPSYRSREPVATITHYAGQTVTSPSPSPYLSSKEINLSVSFSMVGTRNFYITIFNTKLIIPVSLLLSPLSLSHWSQLTSKFNCHETPKALEDHEKFRRNESGWDSDPAALLFLEKFLAFFFPNLFAGWSLRKPCMWQKWQAHFIMSENIPDHMSNLWHYFKIHIGIFCSV